MRNIRLTESQFNRLVSKCVKKAINEGDGNSSYQSYQHAVKMLNYTIIDDDKVDDVLDAMLKVLPKECILDIVDELISNGTINPDEFPIYGN